MHHFLRGLHARHPVNADQPRCDPLHRELLHAVVDAIREPTPHQRRAVAAVLMVNATSLSASALARLTWDDVVLTRTAARVTVNQRVGRGVVTTREYRFRSHPDRPECLVAALKAVRRAEPDTRLVFGKTGGPGDERIVRRYIASLTSDPRRRPGTPLRSGRLNRILAAASAPGPAALRDHALVLLAYGAALRTTEVINLEQRHIEVQGRGLLLTIPGRREPTAIPASTFAYDPKAAWIRWSDAMATAGLGQPTHPAFPQVSFSHIGEASMREIGLNYLIQQRCNQASLTGSYTFTSLRTGMIRDAVRSGARRHAVAAHADLACLNSVERHAARELVLSANVAGMLGL